jgi:glutathione S-transferase
MTIVHGVGLSPFVRKVLCLLEEKGVAYENPELAPFPKTEELLAMNPLGKIPIFEDGDLMVPDSSVICAYLERVHPNPPLYPSDPKDYARTLWYEEYADTHLAQATGLVFLQRFLRPRFFERECDEEAVQQCLAERLPPILSYLEESIGDREFLVGGGFTLADIATCSPIVNLQLAGENVDRERWPRFAAYVDRILSRPSFKTVLAE